MRNNKLPGTLAVLVLVVTVLALWRLLSGRMMLAETLPYIFALLFTLITVAYFFRQICKMEKTIEIQVKALADDADALNVANEELQMNNEELLSNNEELTNLNDQYISANKQLEQYKNHLEELVTQRVEELKASEERYSLLVNTIMYPVLVSTFDGEILFMNDSCSEFFGIDPHQIGAANMKNLWANPDDRVNFVNELAKHSYVQNRDIKLRRPSGEVADGLISSSLIDYNGRKAILSVLNDITNRKKVENLLAESEILYKTIINSSQNLICSLSADDFRLISFNDELFRYHQSRGVEIKAGMTPVEIYGDTMLARERIAFYERTLKEGTVFQREYQSSTGDRWFNFRFHLMKKDEKPFAIAVYGNDITAIKEKEKQLRESEEKLRLMLDNSIDAFGLINASGEQIFLTAASERSTGFTIGELKGSFVNVIHPDDLEIVMEAWKKVLANKDETVRVQYRHKHKYREYIWYEAFARNYLDNPALNAVLINVRDITSIKEAEKLLKDAKENAERSDERFRTISRLSNHLVYEYDLVNDLILWDGAIKEVTGFEPEEYNYTTINDWLEFIHPDDKEQTLQLYYQSIEKLSPYKAFYRYRCKDGSYRWIEEDSHFVEIKDNKPLRMFGVMKDITERRIAEENILKSEEKYRLLAENINDVIWKFDVNTNRYTYFSPSVYKLTGYTVEEALNLTLEQIVMPDSLAQLQVALPEWVDQFKACMPDSRIRTFEYQIRHKNGHPVWVEINATLVTGFENEVVEVLATSRNIEDRKMAEKALRESEERFRISFEKAGLGIALLNINQELVHTNTKFQELLGYSNEELLAKSIYDVTWAEDVGKDLDLLYQLMDGKIDSYQTDMRYINSSGSLVYALRTISLVKDRHGNILYIIALIEDVTQRKLAEKALRESEERYSLITRLSGYVVFDFDIRKQKILFAGAVEEVTGYTADELNNMNYEELLSLIHPDDRNRVSAEFTNYKERLKPNTDHYQYITKNKGIIWIETTAFIINDTDNAPARWLGIMRDITEQRKIESFLKESEEKLRTIFNSSNDGIILLNTDLTILDINQSALTKTGYAYGELDHKNILHILSDDGMRLVQQHIESLKFGNKTYSFETEIIVKDRSFLPVEVTTTNLRINEQDAILLIARDISERKKLERELLNSVINTEELERLQFSQELHDGLGPIISAIKMYIQLLTMPETKMDTKEIAAEAELLINEASNTVREISFKLSPHILQNYGIIEAINAYIDRIQESKKVAIHLSHQNIERFTELIETVIYRVLCECLNNSVKHAKATVIEISLNYQDGLLVVKYTDNGKGFDVEQVLKERKGIGLLNIQSRLRSINGSMQINSDEGMGSNFIFKIKV